jgi:nucleotidyltransferase/DNA polymerase involved in DNA repair
VINDLQKNHYVFPCPARSDFKTVTRAKTLDHTVDSVEEIRKAAFECLGRVELKNKKVRLIGVRAGNLEKEEDV